MTWGGRVDCIQEQKGQVTQNVVNKKLGSGETDRPGILRISGREYIVEGDASPTDLGCSAGAWCVIRRGHE